jgi:uncharacterized phage protein (TIGR02216 family)
MAEATPWPRLLAVAQQVGVTPAAFWRLSLKEWRALVAPANETLTRSALDALAQRFPDEQNE